MKYGSAKGGRAGIETVVCLVISGLILAVWTCRLVPPRLLVPKSGNEIGLALHEGNVLSCCCPSLDLPLQP
jgi:hypothetical protein